MKKFSLISISLIPIFIFCGCSNSASSTDSSTVSTSKHFYNSTDAVTTDNIIEMSTPNTLLSHTDRVRIDTTSANPQTNEASGSTSHSIYVKNGDIISCNQRSDSDSSYALLYFTNSPDDTTVYSAGTNGNKTYQYTTDQLDEIFSASLIGFENYDETTISSASEDSGLYIIDTTSNMNGELYATNTITCDPVTGYISEIESTYYYEDEPKICITQKLTHSSEISIDTSPKDANS